MRSRLLQAMCCAAATVAIVAFVAPGVHADDYNKLTYFTFSGAVQVPGVTLPAGTYTFKLADPATSRRVIQIWNKENTHLYTTALTIPEQRLDVSSDKPMLMFKETPSGEAPAVQAWYYPGESTGYEFVYPKNQAVKIAMASHQPVASLSENSTGSSSAALGKASIGHVDANGQFSNGSATARAAVQAPAPVATSGPAATPAPAARKELPRTASSLPLIELLSALSLAGAFGTRVARKYLTEN